MDTTEFLQQMELPTDATLDAVEEAFIVHIKARLQTSAENYAESELQTEEKWLRGQFAAYFIFTGDWIIKNKYMPETAKEAMHVKKIKEDAESAQEDLQKYITEFASVYMHLGRFTVLLRDEIKGEEKRKASMNANTNARWSADVGMMINRYRKEKDERLGNIHRLKSAIPVIEHMEANITALTEALVGLFGKDKASPFIRSLTAAFRTLDYEKIKRTTRNVLETKKRFTLDQNSAKKLYDDVKNIVQKTAHLIHENEKTLEAPDKKVYLKTIEIKAAIQSDIKDLGKIKGYLSKYHGPYMQHKLNAINHLKEKLMVINTFESLMVLYKRMIIGIASPLSDIKEIRLYESEVVNHVQYLLQGHFKELPNILLRGEETVQEFRDTRKDFAAMEALPIEATE
jgi:hypothetical protein